MVLINGGNSIYVLFWSSAHWSFYQLPNRFQRENSNLARKKEHFMAGKRVFQIQYGCLKKDCTLENSSVLTLLRIDLQSWYDITLIISFSMPNVGLLTAVQELDSNPRASLWGLTKAGHHPHSKPLHLIWMTSLVGQGTSMKFFSLDIGLIISTYQIYFQRHALLSTCSDMDCRYSSMLHLDTPNFFKTPSISSVGTVLFM